MTSRIDFSTRFTGPETLVVVVLVAGVPIVLVPAGTAPTATAVSSGTVDPMWWPGVGALTYDLPVAAGISPVRAWLDPASSCEVYKKADALKGDAKVEPLTFDLHDPSGAATAVLSAPRSRLARILTASVTSASTLIPLDSIAAVASSGIAWIGREALIYNSAALGTLGIAAAPATRGAFGSRARGHTVDPTKPPIVTFGAWPRYWYGRTTSVWLCRMVGTTLYDPTMIFLGTVGPGVQRSQRGTRWQLPVDHITETLSRKIARRSVTLFGINHLDTNLTERAPLYAGKVGTYLGNSGTFDRDGWHPDFASFAADWTTAASTTYADPVTASVTGDRLAVHITGLGSEQGTPIVVAWDTNPLVDVRANTLGVMDWSSQKAPPDTCVHLSGKVPLPFPGDLAKIPSGLVIGHAGYILTARKTANSSDPLSARIAATGTNGSMPWVAVDAIVPATLGDRDLSHRALITARTSVELGVLSSGADLTVLSDAARALDALDGGLHEDAIDWDQISRVMDSVPLGTIPAARSYTFGDGDTILSALSHELRLRGMALCTRYGRLAAFRTAVFASTEETSATITTDDVLTDPSGVPLEPEVIDAESPAATSILFTLPGGASYQWIDDTGRAEFGDGAEVACRALEWVPPGTDLSAVAWAIQQSAQQVLGALAEPYRTVRVILGPRFLGLQEGDLALFSHRRVPTLTGTVGVESQTCQIEEVRLVVMGGQGRVVAALRLQEPDLAGYAPEALVAAGGLSAASAVVTCDTGSAFGATCFARSHRPDGTASTNALDGFTAGDHVVLSQLARAPIADEAFTIASLDPVAGTVTLSGLPSAGMAAAAAAQYGVILRFADWTVVDAASTTVRDRQERYLYVANATTQQLGGADPPKRWAA